MSVLSKLKSLFILEDNTPQDHKNVPSDKVSSSEDSSSSQYTPPDITVDTDKVTPPPGGKPDPKFIHKLMEAIEKADLEGFDYLEYKSSLKSLSSMDMDEETRYKSAMAMAKTMGMNKEKLIATAQHYLDVLEQEKKEFNIALESQKSKRVEGREDQINNMLKSISQKEAKIRQLQKEIEEDKKKVEELKSTINKAAAKVQKTTDNFHFAYNVVTSQIKEDMKKMQKYL